MKTPAVSVVIPVYNRPLAVVRAIESVVAQTWQDFEIIVVDDGSSADVSASVAAIADHRLTLIRHDRNLGGSAARNSGIRASSAPLLAFLDSDDQWLPTKLERQIELFARSDERTGLAYVGAERIYADGSSERYVPKRHAQLARSLLTLNVIGETSLVMLRRSTLEVVGSFDETLPASQDLDLWLRICERFEADFVPEVLVRVAKGNDRDRISANVTSTTRGRELFLRKHRVSMTAHGVLHEYLRDTGWLYHRESRDARRARDCYRASLAVKPTAPLTYALLLMASLPISWLDRVASWKRQTSLLLDNSLQWLGRAASQ